MGGAFLLFIGREIPLIAPMQQGDLEIGAIFFGVLDVFPEEFPAFFAVEAVPVIEVEFVDGRIFGPVCYVSGFIGVAIGLDAERCKGQFPSVDCDVLRCSCFGFRADAYTFEAMFFDFG